MLSLPREAKGETMSHPAEVSSTRLVVDNETVRRNLGLLGELAGTWTGQGFNLIARPDHKNEANLYLQLNQTHETLTITSIGSAIPNRGFGQDDIDRKSTRLNSSHAVISYAVF